MLFMVELSAPVQLYAIWSSAIAVTDCGQPVLTGAFRNAGLIGGNISLIFFCLKIKLKNRLQSTSRDSLSRTQSQVRRMLLTGMITFGFGSACCIGVAALAYAQFKSIHAINWKTAAARAFAYSYAIVSTLFGAYWCWLIFATCWQLITDPDGPGALGSLIFPFWAAIAATPTLIGIILLRTVKGRRRRYVAR